MDCGIISLLIASVPIVIGDSGAGIFAARIAKLRIRGVISDCQRRIPRLESGCSDPNQAEPLWLAMVHLL
jgi:hypothetical protein